MADVFGGSGGELFTVTVPEVILYIDSHLVTLCIIYMIKHALSYSNAIS